MGLRRDLDSVLCVAHSIVPPFRVGHFRNAATGLDDENLVNRDPYLQNAQFSPFLSCATMWQKHAYQLQILLPHSKLGNAFWEVPGIRKSSDCLLV